MIISQMRQQTPNALFCDTAHPKSPFKTIPIKQPDQIRAYYKLAKIKANINVDNKNRTRSRVK